MRSVLRSFCFFFSLARLGDVNATLPHREKNNNKRCKIQYYQINTYETTPLL